MSRRKAREIAFKVLFQVDQVNADPHHAFTYLLEENNLPDKDRDFSWQLITGSLEQQSRIDQRISVFSHEWDMERMPSVDRNIMRMAGYEILFSQDSQPVVAIDEAIEIAKKYGDEGSAGFVNAILDKILGEKNDIIFRY